MSIIGFETEENAFLSNFYGNEQGSHYGNEWMTNEHFYQAHKTFDPYWFEKIKKAATPHISKKLGRQAPLRPDWEKVKLQVMIASLRLKFEYESPMSFKLLATGRDTHLEEANWWGDEFWGTCRGKGENWLGKCLMEVRSELFVLTGWEQ